MFRAIILPIFRSTRLCVTACSIMHPRCCRPPDGNIVGAPGDGQNNCPKHVELTGIITKPYIINIVSNCLVTFLRKWITINYGWTVLSTIGSEWLEVMLNFESSVLICAYRYVGSSSLQKACFLLHTLQITCNYSLPGNELVHGDY